MKFKSVLLFIIIAILSLPAHSISGDFIDTKGDAENIIHISGSCLGTLVVNKYTDLGWTNSAAFIFFVGCAWELGDELISGGTFGSGDAALQNLASNFIGIILSYPLKYDNKEFRLSKNRISFSVVF